MLKQLSAALGQRPGQQMALRNMKVRFSLEGTLNRLVEDCTVTSEEVGGDNKFVCHTELEGGSINTEIL